MKNLAKTAALLGLVGLLAGCSGPISGVSETGSAETNQESVEALPAVNEGFLRACLFFKNQDGYATMAENFYADKRPGTISSWTQGLPAPYKKEVEDFFEPYDEDWGRNLIVYMAIDGSPKESAEWVNLQIKCMANDIEIEFPKNVY